MYIRLKYTIMYKFISLCVIFQYGSIFKYNMYLLVLENKIWKYIVMYEQLYILRWHEHRFNIYVHKLQK